ncbi:DUF2971 domain-containing protein [Domibacillus epiphyticus]|uniref:DUF2971 domain-containing protein n=1 Tax=Domibacillus epiphyticus TaxID=1714355 RepID=A0A1V2A4J5_9BACI|nr:DUF2971 domain-containing protein [Domibacillus epiphyticus]OMP65734.1 hypothetical protein BTO28_15825 [Domibacillus epiphyticus]
MEKKFSDIKRIDDIHLFLSSLKADQLPLLEGSCSLFHYSNGNGVKSIVENREIWLSKSEFLNDKLERKYTLDLVLSIIQEFLSPEPNNEELLFSKWFKQMMEQDLFSFEIFTLSFSRNGDSNLLWSNYSNNDGYNIEFSYPEIGKIFIENLKMVYPNKEFSVYPYFVIYNKQDQIHLLKREIINLYKLFLYDYCNGEKQFQFQKGKRILANIVCYSIFFKDHSFHQEEEFRIAVFHPYKNEKPPYQCRLSNGVFIPYIKIPISNHGTNMPIKGITIGPKNSLDIAEEGLKHFLILNGLSDVSISRSKIPYRY